jgi:hypothetical protein
MQRAARLVSRAGIEPATNWLKANCSTTELPALGPARLPPKSPATIRTGDGSVNRHSQTPNRLLLLHFRPTTPHDFPPPAERRGAIGRVRQLLPHLQAAEDVSCTSLYRQVSSHGAHPQKAV